MARGRKIGQTAGIVPPIKLSPKPVLDESKAHLPHTRWNWVYDTLRWYIGNEIKKRRYAMQITQDVLAERAQITQTSMSRAERMEETSPTLMTLVKIADAFDCDLVIKFKERK